MTLELNAALGIRNDIAPERFGLKDLASGINVDLDETGKAYRRRGVTRQATGAYHSLWSSGSNRYVVKDGVLVRLGASLTQTPIVPVAGQRVSYAAINGEVYWSDAVRSGVLNGAINRAFGIGVPLQPIVSRTIGDMPACRLLITMTYLRGDQEGGAPPSVEIVLPMSSGLSFVLPVSSDPLVTSKRIYVSTPDGELPMLAAELPNSFQSLTLSALPNLVLPVRTQYMGPPPPGQIVGYAFGRSFVAAGAYLWYSQPHEYELFDYESGYAVFNSALRTFAPVSDGIYVGSENEIIWLGGKDPALWEPTVVANYGGVLGTECELPAFRVGKDGASGNVMTFMTTRGMGLAPDGGGFRNLTGGRYTPPEAVAGASVLRIRDGSPLLTTVLHS